MTAAIEHIVFDCRDPQTIAGFWSAVLGYVRGESHDVSIRHSQGHGPWLFFITVPESKTVKNRVHLDLVAPRTMASEVQRLIGLGAAKLREARQGESIFTVMLDPEGNEFCVEHGPEDRGESFDGAKSDGQASTIRSITIDCVNPARLAAFWSEATGYHRGAADEEGALVNAPTEADPRLLFMRVPESKSGKNRVHLDLNLGPMDAATKRLETLGARQLHLVEENGFLWTIMADLENNEFCVMNRE